MEIITTHTNTDFDGLASMVAAGKLHPGAQLVLPGAADRNVREFLALHADLLDIRSAKQVDLERVTRLIVVDTQSRSRLGDIERVFSNPKLEVIIYNHHTTEECDIPYTRLVSKEFGATTTILCEEIMPRGISLAPFEATLFALGIYEDTGSLTFHNTTPSDLRCAAWLLEVGADLDVVAEFIHRALSEEQRKLLNELVLASRTMEIGGLTVTLTSAKRRAYISELALMAHRLRELESTSAVFVLAEMEGCVYVVARSSTDRLNVAEVVQGLGGGGHSRAASAQVKGKSLRSVEQFLLEAIEKYAKPEPVAAEIMSRPPRTVEPNASIEDAVGLMRRYGHSGLCVVEGGKVVGIITRKDADKARHHNLTHAPVKGFMSRDVVCASPNTPLTELERLMIHCGVGRIPILDNGVLVGVVTRGDLLRALHGQRYAQEPVNVTPILETRLPENARQLLQKLGAVAEDIGMPAYLVGGIVRDLLLGRPNLDLDIVVEGDAIELAHKLAEILGAEVKAHERFGTAKLRMPDGSKVDLATARTESYAHPGALPEVEHSSIEDDLRRRDFTINAMAVRIGFTRFGELLDPFNGRRDLSSRTIRVMHNLSFVEDPTRIIRAARFEVRLGFHMDNHTESLALEAVQSGVLNRLTPDRLRRELLLCMAEPSPVEVLLRLDALGVLKAVHPNMRADESFLLGVEAASTWYASLQQRDKLDREMLFTAAMLRSVEPDAAEKLCSAGLRFPPTRAALVKQILALAPQIASSVEKGLSNSQLYEALSEAPVEALVFATAIRLEPEFKEVLAHYLKNLRHVKLQVSGGDFVSMGYKPGPALGAALRDALHQKLDGRLKGRKEEVEYVLRKLSEVEVQVAD